MPKEVFPVEELPLKDKIAGGLFGLGSIGGVLCAADIHNFQLEVNRLCSEALRVNAELDDCIEGTDLSVDPGVIGMIQSLESKSQVSETGLYISVGLVLASIVFLFRDRISRVENKFKDTGGKSY